MNKANQQNTPQYLLVGKGIPNYKRITAIEINLEIPILLKDLNDKFSNLERQFLERLSSNELLTWEEVMNPLYKINESLRWSWGAVCHLNAVSNTPELREAHSNQQPEVIRFINKIGQSKIIHQALTSLKEECAEILDETQIRILDKELKSMNQRGVGLSGVNQEAFNSASEKLAELSTTFSNNVLDATKDWSLLLTKKSEIEGLPLRALEILANSAIEAGDKGKDGNDVPNGTDGPWRLGLDMPRYMPFMTYSTNRDLREFLYKAYVSRASQGNLDNKPLIQEILNIRIEQARRLGHKSWAELSLTSKMATDINAVEQLLEELRSAAMPTAKKELKALKACAKRNGAIESNNLAAWDINYWSERLKQEELDLNQEELRPWFPLPQVLEGLFKLCEKLFDIYIEPADGDAPIWHKDVRFFKVHDKNDVPLSYFFLDPYSRPANKRGGAWMDECLGREVFKDSEVVLPVAYLICNQTQPSGEKPSLMSFDEVETLFHEFGHGLQHMLTTVNYPQAAGINNVEWDAVELPSQFMENWCLDRETLMGMARHWKTGEPLAEKEFEKLKSSRRFNNGLATLRQVNFALTDLRLHSTWEKDQEITPDQLRREISKDTSLIPPIKEDQFLCAFSHIFSGGYSAGYYSYKWAEVLSADAYAAFEEVSPANDINQFKIIGKRFRDTILSLGGSKSPDKIFKAFRGRTATTKALIRHSGLVVNT